MVAPSPAVRAVTYERDGEKCVSCGSFYRIEYQHRRATGNGGSKMKPALPDGMTTCSPCNGRYESDWQMMALVKGWKVRKWVDDTTRVPVYFERERQWYRFDRVGRRHRMTTALARAAMLDVYGSEYETWERKAL